MADNILETLGALGSIEVQKYDRTGNPISIISTTDLVDIAQICAQNEGYINISKKIIGGTAFFVCEFSVELSNVGAIATTNDEYLRVTIRNFSGKFCPTTLGTVNATLNMYSIGAPLKTNSIIEYKSIGIKSGSETSINTEGAHLFAVPVRAIVFAEMRNNDGHTWRVEKDELQLISGDLEEIHALYLGSVVPMVDMICIPVQFSDSVKLKTDKDVNVYMISNRTI
jgi:hypothetical protein